MSSGVIGRQGLVHHGRSLVESLRCATVLSYSTNRNIVDGIDGTVMPVHFGPGRVAAQDSQEGIATVGGRVQFMEKWHSGLGLLEMMQTKPKDALGLYVDLPSKGPPEAAAEFYHHPELTKAKVHQYNYGCKGAMQEFDLSGKHMCIMRPSMQEVLETVMESEPGAVLDMVVDGWKGSGKSMTLYALASAAREAGWIVMYVPSASLLVRGGIYKKKEEEEQEWYTPVAAHHMLKAVMDMHSSELEKLPSLDAKGSLAQQCKRAIETDDYFEKVDGAVALLQGLLHGDGVNGLRTLVIVDEYNYLYSRTEYHETMHRFHRRRIEPKELKLAASFRLLENSRENGIVVAAPCFSGPVSPKLAIPMSHEARVVQVPRYSLNEVAVVSAMLKSRNVIPDTPSDDAIRRALALTNGNGKEIRQGCVSLFQNDNDLPLSFGYKILSQS